MSEKYDEKVSDRCKEFRLPEPEREFRFDEIRRFRFDYAWTAEKVALEVNGITSAGGRHASINGAIRDWVKANLAQLHGWIMLQYTPAQLLLEQTWIDVAQALQLQQDRGECWPSDTVVYAKPPGELSIEARQLLREVT